MSGLSTNVLSARSTAKRFYTSPLVHIHQKEKIAVEIEVKIASVLSQT